MLRFILTFKSWKTEQKPEKAKWNIIVLTLRTRILRDRVTVKLNTMDFFFQDKIS